MLATLALIISYPKEEERGTRSCRISSKDLFVWLLFADISFVSLDAESLQLLRHDRLTWINKENGALFILDENDYPCSLVNGQGVNTGHSNLQKQSRAARE